MIASDPTHSHTHPSDTHTLTPRDYLNNSRSDPAPFEFCPVFGPGDAIAARRGQFELLKSRLHMGTGARVQRVLHKAMSGAPVTMSILGGSSESPSVRLIVKQLRCRLQSPHVQAQEMIRSARSVTLRNFSTGGTRSSRILQTN